MKPDVSHIASRAGVKAEDFYWYELAPLPAKPKPAKSPRNCSAEELSAKMAAHVDSLLTDPAKLARVVDDARQKQKAIRRAGKLRAKLREAA